MVWSDVEKGKRQLSSVQITRLHYVQTKNFDFTKSQCLWRKVAILSLHQFSSFKDPVRNHTGKFRRSICRQEHDGGNLCGRTPWLRDSPQGKLYSSWPAPAHISHKIDDIIRHVKEPTQFLKGLMMALFFASGYLKDSLQINFANWAMNFTLIERLINVCTRLDSNSLF